MNADGTGVTRVTDPSVNILQANMSPNGKKIAFIRSDTYDLYVMNADGTGLTRIYGVLPEVGNFEFSPDGKKIAITLGGDIWVMNADGTDLTNVIFLEGDVASFVRSRNGTKIFLVNARSLGTPSSAPSSAEPEVTSQAYEVNIDGTGITNVSNSWASLTGLAWSLDCKKVAFLRDNDIYVRYPDGQETQITYIADVYSPPVFSPGCRTIAFSGIRTQSSRSGQESHGYREINVINSDGTGLTRLTKGHNDIPIGWRSE
jgi:Tol biopolymer transport system component